MHYWPCADTPWPHSCRKLAVLEEWLVDQPFRGYARNRVLDEVAPIRTTHFSASLSDPGCTYHFNTAVRPLTSADALEATSLSSIPSRCRRMCANTKNKYALLQYHDLAEWKVPRRPTNASRIDCAIPRRSRSIEVAYQARSACAVPVTHFYHRTSGGIVLMAVSTELSNHNAVEHIGEDKTMSLDAHIWGCFAVEHAWLIVAAVIPSLRRRCCCIYVNQHDVFQPSGCGRFGGAVKELKRHTGF